MAMTKEKLAELITTATGRFIDDMKARTSIVSAIVTDDTCTNGGYSPYFLGGIGSGRRWIGNRVYTKLKSYGVKFTCEKFEKTVEIPSDELTDNPAVDGAKIGARLAESAVLTEEKETLAVLKNNVAGFDLDPLFGTHEYVDQNADGSVMLAAGQPVVLGAYVNDIEGAGEAWFLASKKSIVRVTQAGEDYNVVMKGGSAESSEYTFDTDNLAWGWKARKIFRGGMPYYTIRSKASLTGESFQAAQDLGATFTNDAGELVDNRFTHIIVKRGTAPAAAARKLFTQAFLANGESNIYATVGIIVLEVDHI
jgi:phage major head subunit gpT-like protein